jgi:hypothetical protein
MATRFRLHPMKVTRISAKCCFYTAPTMQHRLKDTERNRHIATTTSRRRRTRTRRSIWQLTQSSLICRAQGHRRESPIAWRGSQHSRRMVRQYIIPGVVTGSRGSRQGTSAPWR